MDIRVIVKLKWDSSLRKQLFSVLKNLGYTWSRGDSLDSDYTKLHNMAYIAIYVNKKICSYSSNLKIGLKPESECGLNYLSTSKNVFRIIDTINYIKQYLKTNPSNEDLKLFVYNHHMSENLIKIL